MFFPGVREHVPLAQYSTFRIGGPADYFYELNDLSQLTSLLKAAKEKNLRALVIGNGSNVLFSDSGFRGLVIRMAANNISITEDLVKAEAGALVSKIIHEAAQKGLGGLIPLFGIPGTIGGALFGNAGAHGVCLSQFLTEATLLDPKTLQQKTVPRDYFQFSYRSSILKKTGEYVLSVTLKLPRLDEKEVENVRATVLRKRKERQPGGYSAGSFFKNPPDHPAGYYIDQAGCKGMRVGGAQVSEKHANFFLNVGNATCKDMLELRDCVKTSVRQKFGVLLEEEVRIISE